MASGELTDRERIERLERLVEILARGILLHEYAKDLSRQNTETALRELERGALNKAIIEAGK